jgi:Transposase DDE domain
VEVLEPAQGLSWRGTADDKLISGDVLRKLLVKLENHVDLNVPLRLPPYAPSVAVKVRKRASRRAVKGAFDVAEAEARAQQVAAQLVAWYNDPVGPSLLDYARVGPGRRIHIVDTTHVEVPLETGTYECNGVVKNDDGSRSRGYKLVTLRTFLDHAGLMTQVSVAPIQVHDAPLCRLLFETASVLRAGDVVLEDRGFIDGETITFLKQQRHVDVIVPLKSNLLSYNEAVQ